MNMGLSRKSAVLPIELVPIYFMVWRVDQAGCPSSVAFSYNMASPHLMLGDKALFPVLEGKLAALGLWESGFCGQFHGQSRVILTRHDFCLMPGVSNLIHLWDAGPLCTIISTEWLRLFSEEKS